jgi:hypothetical protein
MPSKNPSAKVDPLEIPSKPPIKKSFLPEVISSDKIDTLRKNISTFDKAIQAAKDTSAKYWEVDVY